MPGPEDSDPALDDPVIRAGEYSLGLLEGPERAAAVRELLAGAEFAHAVAWWDQRFATLAEEAGEVAPGVAVWPAIAGHLAGPADGTPANSAPTGLGGWRLAGALAGTAAVAAALVLFLAVPDASSPPPAAPPTAQVTAPQLVLQASGEDPAQTLTTRIDRAAGTLNLQVAGFSASDTASTSPELWVIPAGAEPVSLGLIPGTGRFDRALTENELRLLAAGAQLAVTIEDRSSAPHAAPTPPIMLAGALTEI